MYLPQSHPVLFLRWPSRQHLCAGGQRLCGGVCPPSFFAHCLGEWSISARRILPHSLTIMGLCHAWFIFRERGQEGERERNINVWLPLVCPPLGAWPATQACALSGNRTCDPLLCSLAFSPLSHTSQGCAMLLIASFNCVAEALFSRWSETHVHCPLG